VTTLLTEVQTSDKMVEIARDQVDAFSKGDWDRVRVALASDSSLNELGTQRQIEGLDKIVELFKGWKQAFPDAAGTVTSSLASGNTAVLEVTWKGTHTGPLTTAEGTIPASGKRQETPAAIFFTFEGNKIKEARHYFDSLTLLKQIGALPK